MNIFVFIAGILSLVAFLAHAIIGDKEYRQLRPAGDSDEKKQETWIQARAGWHWVSVDLLLSGILCIAIATSNLVKAKSEVLLLLSIYFLITGIVWLCTVIISKNTTKQIVVLGQWIFCFIVAALLYYGRLNSDYY